LAKALYIFAENMTTMEEFFKSLKENIERAQAIWIIKNMDLIRGYEKIKYTLLAYLQNKTAVENLEEVDNCFNAFSTHFSKIYSVLEEEGPKEWYDEDYEYLSAQLKQAKQHLDQILM
jgi:hypothetical protein